MKTIGSLSILLVLFFNLPSWSQESVTLKEEVARSTDKSLGWNKSADLGVNLSFSSSQDMIGQTDGTSETYGTTLKSSFDYLTEEYEWRNSFHLLENITKTPALPRFIKSNDELKLDSILLYSLKNYPRIGPYVKAEAFAPLFKGEDVQSTLQNYVIESSDGTVVGGPIAADSYRLTDSLRPLTTKESIGFFFKARNDEILQATFRVGFGAIQVRAKDQLARVGTDAAGNIQLRQLDDVNQAGLELGLAVKGKVDEKTGYEIGAESLTPFINNRLAGDDRNAVRLTNIDAFVKLSSNITSWASFGYDYRMRHQPQLIDRVQSVHMIVINMKYNLF